jgi:hypothetical protein
MIRMPDRDRQPTEPSKRLRIFFDADVIFAAAASPSEQAASLVLLRLAEISLVEALTCAQVVQEVERNLRAKIPSALPVFQVLAGRCLAVLPDPEPAEVRACAGSADWKDLPILVAAAQSDCPYLASFHLRHFLPGLPQVEVLEPGALVMRLRDRLVRMD